MTSVAISETKRHVLLSLAGILVAMPSLSQSPDNYGKAMAEFKARNYATAATLFAAVETEKPGSTDAMLMEGKCLVNLGNFPEAETSLRRYISMHSNSDDALYLLGFVLNRRNRPSESLAIYTKAATIKTPTADDLKIVGLNYVLLGDYPDAIKWLEKSVQFDAKNHDAWYYLGRSYYSRGLLPEARNAFVKVLELNPHDARAENNLGLIFETEGKPDEAMQAYRTAIKWQETDIARSEQPYLNLGNLLIQQDRLEEAIPLLEQAVQIAPKESMCRLRLGVAYFRSKRLVEAQHELEEAIRLSPDSAAAHYQLGRFYKQINSLDRAKDEFDRVEEIQSRAARTKPPTP